ncbi:MAG: hypothetical protein AB1346_12920 [Thermodesulfobacteriota bacterium]
MKSPLIIMLVALVALLSDVGQASIGGVQPPDAGTLILFGTGVVGFAIWGRRRLKR